MTASSSDERNWKKEESQFNYHPIVPKTENKSLISKGLYRQVLLGMQIKKACRGRPKVPQSACGLKL
jgi:hypothetical protein